MLSIQKILGFKGLIGKVFANDTSAPTAIKTNLSASTNPGAGDDSGDGYAVGSEWYNTTLKRMFICSDATVGAAVWREVGGRSETIVAANSFSSFDVLKKTGGSWAKAQADAAANAVVIGIVEDATGTEFSIVYNGKVRKSGHGFTVGALLYLSPSSPGALTATEPTSNGHVSKPLAVVLDSDYIVFFNQRGEVISDDDGIPVGAMIDFGMDTLPAGYIPADGSNVSRTTYADLFAKYGTTHGSGDGSTTFGVPDCRRRTKVGKGGSGTATLGNAVGNTGGSETHTLIISEMPSHSHTFSYVTNSLANGGNGREPVGGSTEGTSAAGGGGAHNNMQPSIVCTVGIKV